VPAVPSWLASPSSSPPDITAAVTLDGRILGTTADSSKPTIYHLHLTNPFTERTIESVTLPNLGSTFTDACNTPTLHILAMTTS